MKKLQNAIETVKSMKGELIGFAPEDAKYPDGYLYVVIAKFTNEYTVWGYNAEFNGMFNGFYTQDYNDALSEFKRRIS